MASHTESVACMESAASNCLSWAPHKLAELSRSTTSLGYVTASTFRFLLAYAFIHVPGTVNTQDVRCCLQEMPPGHPDRCRGISIPIDHGRVLAVRGKAPLSALRGIPRTNRSAREGPEAHGGNLMFDPDAHPAANQSRNDLSRSACLIAGIRPDRERQGNIRVVPTRQAIEESVELAHEIFNRIVSQSAGAREGDSLARCC